MILGKYITYIFGELNFDEYGFLKAVEEMISDMFDYYLKGKQIPGDNGKKYKVKECVCNYVQPGKDPSGDFYSVNVFLEDYEAEEYFLYDDWTFEKELDKLIPIFKTSYSESGMQGKDFINLDVFSILKVL